MSAGAAAGLSSAMLDRLKLNAERIEALAKAVEHIISLPDPVGDVIEGHAGEGLAGVAVGEVGETILEGAAEGGFS